MRARLTRLEEARPVQVSILNILPDKPTIHPADNRHALAPILALLRDADDAYHGGPWPGSGSGQQQLQQQLLLLYLDAGTARSALQARVARSRVLQGKDWRRWDWESVLLLAEDTLRDPARLAEAAARQAVAGSGAGTGRVSFLKRVCDSYRLAGADRGAWAHLLRTARSIDGLFPLELHSF